MLRSGLLASNYVRCELCSVHRFMILNLDMYMQLRRASEKWPT